MQRIFLPPEQITDTEARITGADHLHLARVLRMREGQAVTVLDGQGNAFRAVLVSIGKSDSTARIEGSVDVPPEPPVCLTIMQALGKGDKFEQVIQHGTEAGASAFIPLRAERCVVDVPSAKVADKVARWQQIAKSAAEQSGRGIVPTVTEPLTFANLLAGVNERGQSGPVYLLLHPDADAVPLSHILQTLDTTRPIFFAIGPEGGWSPNEIAAAQQAGVSLASLGPRILRTETAALVAIAQILYHFESAS